MNILALNSPKLTHAFVIRALVWAAGRVGGQWLAALLVQRYVDQQLEEAFAAIEALMAQFRAGTLADEWPPAVVELALPGMVGPEAVEGQPRPASRAGEVNPFSWLAGRAASVRRTRERNNASECRTLSVRPIGGAVRDWCEGDRCLLPILAAAVVGGSWNSKGDLNAGQSFA